MAPIDEPSIASSRGSGLSLVGSRGSGKTTVGRIVAALAGRSFLDLDAEIERTAGRKIAAIFAEDSEEFFRDLEERTLRRVVDREPGAVVAGGGGVVLCDGNRRALRRHGRVVWLAADPATLIGRLRAEPGDRPALTRRGLLDEIEEVLARREALYRSVADWIVETAGRTPEEVGAEVYALWNEDLESRGRGAAGRHGGEA
jgi:shikimate kinase